MPRDDREQALVKLDRDVLATEARNRGLHDQLIVRLIDVEGEGALLLAICVRRLPEHGIEARQHLLSLPQHVEWTADHEIGHEVLLPDASNRCQPFLALSAREC